MSQNVKKGIEHYLYFSHEKTTIVGGININGPADGDLDLTIPNAEALPATGQVLMVVADLAVLSDVDIDIDIEGTDVGDANLTANVVIPARAARSRAVKVGVAPNDVFKTVTDVTVNSGGVAGDTLVILGIPEYARILNPATSVWKYVPFFDGMDTDIGAGLEVIFDHYEPDHYKRTRLDNSISITSRYVDVATGLMLIDGAEVSFRIEVKDDGRQLVTEQQFLCQAKVTVAPSIPSDEGITTLSVEGNFKKKAVELLVP